jgi:hypothetical protein
MPTSPYYIERALRITGHTEGFNHYYQLVRNLRITGNTGSSIYLVRQLSVNGQSIPAPSVPAYLNRALRIAGNTDFFSILLTRQLNITGSLPAPSAELDIISALDEVRIGIRMADFGHRREPLSTPTTPPNLQAVTGATGLPLTTYYYAYSAVSWVGETTLSPISTITITVVKKAVLITIPETPGADVSLYRVFRGTSIGNLDYIGSTNRELYDDNITALYDSPTVNTTSPILSILRSYDNLTWTTLMTGLREGARYIDRPDFDAYYSGRVSYQLFEPTGEPVDTPMDTFYGPISFPKTPVKVWAGVGIAGTDLALEGIYPDTVDPTKILCKTTSGIGYLANGEAWWMGDASKYILFNIDEGVPANHNYHTVAGISTATLPARLLDGQWPITLVYDATEAALAAPPTQPVPWTLTNFQYEPHKDVRVNNPLVFLERLGDPGAVLEYKDWDDELKKSYTFAVGMDQFVVDFEAGTITFCIPDNINHLYLYWGRPSYVYSEPINYPLYRHTQQYVVLANKDWQRPTTLVAEFPRDEVIRHSVDTKLLACVMDENGCPVEDVTVIVQQRIGLSGTEYEDCVGMVPVQTGTDGIATLNVRFASGYAGHSMILRVLATWADVDNISNTLASLVTFVYCEVG